MLLLLFVGCFLYSTAMSAPLAADTGPLIILQLFNYVSVQLKRLNEDWQERLYQTEQQWQLKLDQAEEKVHIEIELFYTSSSKKTPLNLGCPPRCF